MKKNNVLENKSLNKTNIKTLFKDSRVITGIILFVFVTVMFAISVNMRSEYKDYVSTEHHHHLTATSVAFTNNWLDDGIFHDHFAMMANPASVEFPTLKDRSFYDSYPSGCILPLYALAKITGTKEIDFGFVQRWDLFNQYAITLLLAFIVYIIFIKVKKKPYVGAAAAIIPTVINLFMPAPFYFFHSVYFADQAVLLPFVLTVFIELLFMCTDNKKVHSVLSIIEVIVIFIGTLTDYLFLCVLLVVYAKKLIMKEIPVSSFVSWLLGSLKFAGGAIVAIGLFVLQIAINGPVRIFDMFLFRTGINDTSGWTEHFGRVFWKDYIIKGYGTYADIILKAALIIVAVMIVLYVVLNITKKYKNEKLPLILATAAIIIIPCFMQVYLLKNHSAIHDFSSLKFSIVMSVVPYVLIPLAIGICVEQFISLKKKCEFKTYITEILVVVFVLIACVSTYSTHSKNAKSYFPEATPEVVTVGNFLKANTDYNDVVFSDNYENYDTNDYPAKVALAKKRVYKIDSVNQIYNKVKDITEDYTINIFSYGTENHSSELQNLIDKAGDVIREDDLVIYKIDKDAFLSAVK